MNTSQCLVRLRRNVLRHTLWITVIGGIVGLTLSNVAQAGIYDCKHKQCGLLGDGAYPNVILGTLSHVATDAEATTIYHWAHQHGYWKNLQGGLPRFLKTIKIVSVEIPVKKHTKTVTLLMGRKFFDADTWEKGDFVRYTPHEKDLPDKPFDDPSQLAYYQLFGCVAILCRAVDKECFKRYVSGVYGRIDGLQRDLQSGKTVKQGVHIDPVTYFPVTKKK